MVKSTSLVFSRPTENFDPESTYFDGQSSVTSSYGSLIQCWNDLQEKIFLGEGKSCFVLG